VKGCDVIVMLRLAERRMRGALLLRRRILQAYGLTPEKLALREARAIVMHPGPMEPRRRDRLGRWLTARGGDSCRR